jgi:hypothetical protein
MVQKVEGTVTIENARILFRNFAGREGQYNREGDRNFAVTLDPAVAEQMLADGWNVKYLRPREEDEQPTPYVQVSVSYKGRPPRIVIITSKGRTTLPEDMVEIVDWVDIATVDLILTPYNWGPIKGEYGVKAYLKTMYIVIAEDDLDRKYSDVPEIEAGTKPLAITAGPDEDIMDVEVVDD